jgi:hypothetical protein
MYWLLGYLTGACLAGFIFEICYVYIDSFYKFLIREIDNAKDELRKTSNLSDEYRILLDSIDNDAIIKSLEVIILLLSWIGLIIDIIYILAWVFDDTSENKK